MEAWRAHAKAKSHSAIRRGAKSSRRRVRPLSVPDAKRLIGGGFPVLDLPATGAGPDASGHR